MFVLFFTLILLFIFYFINFFLSIKDFYKFKVSVFESGFVSIGKVQNSFSIHFFIMMLMFVIFDLEIVMFLGLLISNYTIFLSLFFLMFFILFGFYMEWFYGKLVWLV